MSRIWSGVSGSLYQTGVSSRWRNLTEWTLNAWVYPTATRASVAAGFTGIINPGGVPVGNNYVPFGLYYGRADTFGITTNRFWAGYIVAAAQIVGDPTVISTYTAWHHLVATFTSTPSRSLRLYRNNILVASSVPGSAIVAQTADIALRLGHSYETSSPRGFPGPMADIALWNAALTPGEVSSLWAGRSPWNIRRANLQAYWPLHGVKAVPDLDLGPNGVGLTNVGAALTVGPHPPVGSFGP